MSTLKSIVYIVITLFLLIIFTYLLLSIYSNRVQVSKEKLNGNRKDIVDMSKIPFKYLEVDGKEALSEINKITKEDTSITPVIMGDNKQISMLADVIEYNTSSPEDIIKRALNINAESYFEKRAIEDSEIMNEVEGTWDDEALPMDHLTACTDILSGKPLRKVYIGLIPSSHSYEAPAYLKYGGWNACPEAEAHVAIMKYWHEKYGAKIVSLTGDTIECTVENPPKTKEEALLLAKEQFLYCEDIVTQGCGSITALAAALMKSKYWYFWWD